MNHLKNEKVLESNVTVLQTPLVIIEIVDEFDRNIAFDIVESQNTKHTVCINYDESKIIKVKNFEEKQIRIRTNSLIIGKTYYVKTSVPIENRDSDERLFTYGYTEGTQTFAISFPDPNEEKKMLPDEHRTEWKWYDFNNEVFSGTKAVSFYLIDREQEFIYIATAWIWNIHDHMFNYECAAEVFTWIV